MPEQRGTLKEFWVWQESPPAGTPGDRPWLAGVWDDNWPAETFTTGQALPPGPIASLGTFHNQRGFEQRFGLRLYSTPHGWRRLMMPFDRIRGESDEVFTDGRFKVQGEAAIIYHRASEADDLMIKLEVPTGLKLLRVYTWIYLVRREYVADGQGGWQPS